MKEEIELEFYMYEENEESLLECDKVSFIYVRLFILFTLYIVVKIYIE